MFSVLRVTASNYPVGIFWPLCCQSFFELRLLIIPLVSFGHCVVSPSSYGFWLSLWYLLAIVLSVLRVTASDYPVGIFGPLCCRSFFELRLLIIPLVSFGHCVVSPSSYGFWLSLWYLLAIVLSVLRVTASDYPFGIFGSLCCQSFYELRLLIIPLVSFGHCVVSPSSYGFWLSLWYLLAIVLSVLLRVTASNYPFGIFWPLCCQSFFELRLLIIPLVSFGHCVVSPSSSYGFWLSLWYLLAIVLSVLRVTASNYPFGIFWPLCCQSFFELRLLIIPLVSFGHCVVSPSSYDFWLSRWYLLAIVLSVLLRVTASDYPFGIFWPLCCQSFFELRLLIIPLVSFGHCVVSPSSSYGFWLSLWYLLAIVLSVLRVTASDYPFGIFWPLCCQSFELLLLIIPLVSFGHCVVSPSSSYGFWLSLWYLLAIVLSVLRVTASDYPVGIFWPLCCQSFFELRLLIIPLVSFGHCVVSPSSYDFWLSRWYLLAIVLSVLRVTASDYPFGIFWPLCCQSFELRLLIIPLVSFGHCVVSPSSSYCFWLSLWYLLAIVLSVLLRVTASNYPFGIFWSLCCQSFELRLLIIPLVSFGHCVVSPSSYGF